MTMFPWLSALIFLPLAGAILTLCFPAVSTARLIAVITAIVETALALIVYVSFDHLRGGEFQFMEQAMWIPGLNIQYLLGIDGISVLFLPATAVLATIAIVASWHSVDRLHGFYFAMMLVLLAVTMGIFMALDTMLFFLFWELTLPPIYFLVSLWGIGPERRRAAMKYTMYMMFGGIPLLFAFILLALNVSDPTSQVLTFSLPQLLASPVASHLQPLLFGLLVLGFAAKAPLFPFHTWLPTIAMESPAQLTALLVGLKLGVYGLLRFALPLAPEAAVNYAWLLGICGALTLLYAAFIALHQTNLRRMLAYASISHVGLVVMGVASLNNQGIQGAVFQLLNFTMIASGLMLMSGFIQQRTGTTELISLGNLASTMPRFTSLFFFLALASIGLPGTSGFAAELLLILGVFKLHVSFGLIALTTIIISAAYLLTHARKTFWGETINPPKQPYADLKVDEMLILLPCCLFALILGFFPGLLVNSITIATEAWLSNFPRG